MNSVTKSFFITYIVLSTTILFSQSAAITIDGVFDDWTSNLATYTDTSESISGVDFLEIQVTNDDQFLFLKIKANTEFDLTDNQILHELGIFIDTDNNSNTGFDIQQGYGSEVGILFTELFAHYNVAPYSQIGFTDLKLRAAPTVTSKEFEIAIGRHTIPDAINPLFTSQTIKILLKNNDNFDKIPNVGDVFSYTFDETPVTPLTPTDINKSNTSHIRIMAYNTLLDGLNDINRVDDFERIIKAINPDIVGFIESANTSDTYVKSLFDLWIPLGTTNGWYVEKHGGEITVSKWEIVQRWDNLTRQFPVLIDLPSNYNTDLLFTNAHLSCCGADANRQDQVDQYAAFILDAKSAGGVITLPENTPFVYSGDLNLVGFSQQLTTLTTGDIQDTASYGIGGPLDWDSSDLIEENCIQTDIRMGYTWRSDGQVFPPGKLDFIIFSDYTLTAEKSFVVQTEVMPANRLSLYNLNQLNTSNASDHFPVIADFSINETLNRNENSLKQSLIFPNPTNNHINISLKALDNYTVNLINPIGKILISQNIKSSLITLDLKLIPSGLYFISIKNSKGEVATHKIIKN